MDTDRGLMFIMSPLYRGGYILLYLSLLISSSDLLFCVCAFSLSILQAVNVGQHHKRRANINPALVQSIVTVPPTCRYILYVCTKRSPGVAIVLAHSLRHWMGVGWTYILLCCDDDGGYSSVDSTHWPSVDLVTGQRRRRWTAIESALGLFSFHFSCLLGDQMTTNIHFELSYYREYNITFFFNSY